MIPADWQNQAVRSGVTRMLQRRSDALDRGEAPIGWKLAFGAPAFQEKFGLSGPVIGYLTDAGRRPPGTTVSIDDWTRPVAEPEIAAHITRDIDDPAELEEVIGALGPAIELADIDVPPEDIEVAMAGNIYHRAVLLGEPDRTRAGGVVEGLTARVAVDGAITAEVDDVEQLTGRVLDILRHTLGLLQAANETFRAGEVVILGSVVPPLQIESDHEITFELGGMAPVSVRV